jgi:hypothetical protein
VLDDVQIARRDEGRLLAPRSWSFRFINARSQTDDDRLELGVMAKALDALQAPATTQLEASAGRLDESAAILVDDDSAGFKPRGDAMDPSDAAAP